MAQKRSTSTVNVTVDHTRSIKPNQGGSSDSSFFHLPPFVRSFLPGAALFLFRNCNKPTSFSFSLLFISSLYFVTIMFGKLFTVVVVASTAFAHSNMFSPIPRQDRSNAFLNVNANGCENTKTDVPPQNSFARGQKVPLECKLGVVCIWAVNDERYNDRVVE